MIKRHVVITIFISTHRGLQKHVSDLGKQVPALSRDRELTCLSMAHTPDSVAIYLENILAHTATFFPGWSPLCWLHLSAGSPALTKRRQSLST